MLGPGILVAATGVGAGDLATAAFTGNRLGVAILWAVLLGAGIKLILNEGLARWQLATGTTFLEGGIPRLGRVFLYFMLFYLIFWSYFVGSALMSASGVAAQAILPFSDPVQGKILYGLLHSAAGVPLIVLGGYALFEKTMKVCIALMFVTVICTAALMVESWSAVAMGMVWPVIPEGGADGISWTVALMGGVGGTLTILCYGYWIREEGRGEPSDLPVCRIDLGAGYAMTALFGLAMVVIGAGTAVEGSGAGLIVSIGDRLHEILGPFARWAFLLGAWGAIFSSLLGVWQSVPYLFADLYRQLDRDAARTIAIAKSRPYLIYLLLLATVPAVGLWTSFRSVQKAYALVGAAFMPMLAVMLIFLNGWGRRAQKKLPNPLWLNLVLILVTLFFVVTGWYQLG